MTKKERAALVREKDELEDKRKALKLAAVNHRDEKNQDETTEELKKLKARISEIEDELDEDEEDEEKEEKSEEIKTIMRTYANFSENMRAVDAAATPEYRTAWLKKISGRTKELTEIEKRVMTTVNNDAVVPIITLDVIMGRLTAEGTLRSAVTIYNIPNLIEIPIEDIVNDAAWLPEMTNGTVVTDTTKTLKLSHNKLARFIQLTVELQTLSINAVEAWVVDRMVKKMEIGLEKAVATGTGINQPTGFITGTTWNATNSKAVAAGALKYDDMVDLEGLIDEEYFIDSYYIVNRAVLREIRLLKDDVGRPLFDSEVKDGFVGRIGGIPVRLSRYVDGIYLGSWREVWAGNFIKSIEFTTSDEAGFMSVSTIYRAYALFDGKPTGIAGTVARITIS